MKLLSLTTLAFLSLIPLTLHAEQGKIDMHGGKDVKIPSKTDIKKANIFYGKVLEIKPAMGYKYLKVEEEGKEVWVAIASAPVSVGDRVGYDKTILMKNFHSKTLKQDFEEIYFASDVYLPQKSNAPKSMKEMLGLNTAAKDSNADKDINDASVKVAPVKPFVKQDAYTVEEIHMWRKALKDQTITLEGTVSKVSQDIMKRDWVHVGDGSGNEKNLTNDLVFTAPNTSLKMGDKVNATGKVIVDKDFGFGYFYKVIIENSTFEVK